MFFVLRLMPCALVGNVADLDLGFAINTVSVCILIGYQLSFIDNLIIKNRLKLLNFQIYKSTVCLISD